MLPGPRGTYGLEDKATALCGELVEVANTEAPARFWASCEKCWEAAKQVDMSATRPR